MYGENYNEVFLVGDRPSWYKGNMIESDNGGYEYGNGGIFHKVCLLNGITYKQFVEFARACNSKSYCNTRNGRDGARAWY